MSKSRLIVGCSALVLAATVAAPTSAFEWVQECRNRVVWDGTNLNMEVSAADFPVGSPQLAALEQMRTAWNLESPGSRFRFNYTFVANDNVVAGDGRSSVVIATPDQWNDWGLNQPGNFILGFANPIYSRNNCPWLWGAQPRIVEQDVLFNPAPNNGWDFRPNPPPGGIFAPTVFAIVGMHEFGHVFGAAHENDVMGTMDAIYPDGGVIGNFNEIQPHADDTLAVRAGYGTSGTFRDVAASAYQRIGVGNSAIIPAPATAARNQRIAIPFTIENRGTTNQNSVRVEFFLSTDRFITTADRLLGSATFSMNAGTLSTLNVFMTIPATTPAGLYHLGWIVDANNAIGETDEGNNGVGLVGRTNITANAQPNACCTVTPQFGSAPLRAAISGACSNDPDGGALTYTWNFGDGTTGTGQSVNHWYTESGSYLIQLTVREPGGLTDNATCWVDVFCEGNGPFGDECFE
ncbi:MAG: PKD domain-containing protein [Acidobacteriota bacterium]